jgi:hypothetical protein
MVFSTITDEWCFLKNHSVEALADGAPISIAGTDHDGSIGDGYVIESVTAVISVRNLRRFALAKDSKVRLGGFMEYQLTDPGRKEMLAFVDAVKSGKIQNPPLGQPSKDDHPSVAPKDTEQLPEGDAEGQPAPAITKPAVTKPVRRVFTSRE